MGKATSRTVNSHLFIAHQFLVKKPEKTWLNPVPKQLAHKYCCCNDPHKFDLVHTGLPWHMHSSVQHLVNDPHGQLFHTVSTLVECPGNMQNQQVIKLWTNCCSLQAIAPRSTCAKHTHFRHYPWQAINKPCLPCTCDLSGTTVLQKPHAGLFCLHRCSQIAARKVGEATSDG